MLSKIISFFFIVFIIFWFLGLLLCLISYIIKKIDDILDVIDYSREDIADKMEKIGLLIVVIGFFCLFTSGMLGILYLLREG